MKRAPSAKAPAAPGTPAPGAVLWQRLRLEEQLPSNPEIPFWLATDLKTDSCHAVELLPLDSAGQLPTWAKSAASFIPPTHPALLGFYRFEFDRSYLGAISAYDPRLRHAALSQAGTLADNPLQALLWIEDLAHALDELHRAGIRPHGAIVPSRLFLSPNQRPLLTGYPHAAYTRGAAEDFFVPPERKRGDLPTSGDDVFSLSLLAYQLLTNGALAGASRETGLEPRGIDAVRSQRNLPPTGWPTGWDNPIFEVLESSPGSRPSNTRTWFDELSRAVGRHRLGPSLRTAQPPCSQADTRPRRTPPWRKGLRAPAPLPGSATANDPTAFRPVARLRDESEELARQSEEFRQRKRELDAQAAQLEAAKTAHVALEAKLNQQRVETEKKQLELTAKAKALAASESRLETLKRQVDETAARAARANASLTSETTRTVRGRQAAQAEAEADQIAKLQLSRERERLEKQQAELSARAKEVDTQSRTVGDLQRELAGITGSANPAHWRAFLQRLEAQKAENERLSASIEAERRRQDSLRLEAAPGEPHANPGAVPSAGTSSGLSASTQIHAAGSGNESHGTNPPAINGLNPPPAPPVVQENRKATLLTPTGRRIHVFGTHTLRVGRHSNSDVLLVAMISGQAQPTMALNREISRKHFELQISAEEVRVLDGWSDDGKPSQHGLCVDGRRVQGGGAVLKSGMLLSVTTRAPGRSVPYWKVKLFHRGGNAQPSSALSAVWLQRLDDAPEDVAVVLDSASLQELGMAEAPADAAIVALPPGLFFRLGEELIPFTQDASPLTGITVLSVGWCSPTIVVPSS